MWALVFGLISSWLGGFGHNWVHQPKYKDLGWALLSLDTIGFSSVGWFREHNLQHHMYTNTPWDNHFKGTAPWLVTDPTVERNWFQKNICPYLIPLFLCFGLHGNWIFHLLELCKGREVLSVGKLFLPLQLYAMHSRWGVWGLVLMFVSHAVLGNYYFSLALMNHNAETTVNTTKRNKAQDWGEAQLQSSADWGVNMPFWAAGLYLWLNYHTVHHLFPRTDFSHHPAIQAILLKTCEEFNIDYNVNTGPIDIYKQMSQSFASPAALYTEVLVYSGGI